MWALSAGVGPVHWVGCEQTGIEDENRRPTGTMPVSMLGCSRASGGPGIRFTFGVESHLGCRGHLSPLSVCEDDGSAPGDRRDPSGVRARGPDPASVHTAQPMRGATIDGRMEGDTGAGLDAAWTASRDEGPIITSFRRPSE